MKLQAVDILLSNCCFSTVAAATSLGGVIRFLTWKKKEDIIVTIQITKRNL